MPYEYLASVQSAVRRINDRIAKLTKNLGEDAHVLSDPVAKINAMLGDNMRFKGDTVQIIRPSDIFGDEEKMKALKEIEDDLPTWGDLKKQAEASMDKLKYEGNLPEGISVSDFININMAIPDALATLYQLEKEGNTYAIQGLEIMREEGHKRTYDEIQQMFEFERNAVMSHEEEQEAKRRYNI